MENQVFLQMYAAAKATVGQNIYIHEIARAGGEENTIKKLLQLPVYQVKDSDKSHVVIDVITVIQRIKKVDPSIRLHIIGPEQTVIKIKRPAGAASITMLLLVWMLLFIGAALAIMNFHEDVSMLEVHQNIYELVTGVRLESPLLLQIPYSFGLGLGMILFFNHVFRKRINEEPSPLELEMHHYEQDIEKYLADHETDRGSKAWQSKHFSPPSSD
ncbi:stage V sporulation protein AA [Alteribacillus sp. HJP-4]|uniref:stage V sporulation protein AA n=1 Tax=Alteribacillus sp. HJP-4 TaxID=2775394 RepID=UPI0035CCF3B3